MHSEYGIGLFRRLAGTAFAFVLVATGCAVSIPAEAAIDALPSARRGYVSDYTNELSGMDDLERDLAAFHEDNGHEVVVVLLPSLPHGMSTDEAARQLLGKWDVGSSVRDDGVLILAVMDIEQVRIEVGYGLRDVLNDDVSLTLLQTTIAPAFASGDREGGVRAVSLATMGAIERDAPPLSASAASGRIGVALLAGIVVVFIGIVLVSWLRMRRRMVQGGGRSSYRSDVRRRVVTDL